MDIIETLETIRKTKARLDESQKNLELFSKTIEKAVKDLQDALTAKETDKNKKITDKLKVELKEESLEYLQKVFIDFKKTIEKRFENQAIYIDEYMKDAINTIKAEKK